MVLWIHYVHELSKDEQNVYNVDWMNPFQNNNSVMTSDLKKKYKKHFLIKFYSKHRLTH